MNSKQKCFLKAGNRPSSLDYLAEEYSAASLGYPLGLVKVAKCEGRGTGLFAARLIRKGEKVYEDTDRFEIDLTETQLRAHLIVKTPEERKIFLMHCYCYDGALWYMLGIARFTNHSKNPNIKRYFSSLVSLALGASPGSYALRDIKEGEEITEDYSVYHNLAFYEEMCEENGVESTSVCVKKYSI
eukprot:GFUD01022027.1.p1 GENE.GFUD01022027.1~~GFUD01022027.1.p1  ORF type:complete len:186 (+),score=40.46 GFUD01022027.1:23-580(+)